MRFTAEERIAAPAEWVFARLSDMRALERAARRRGAQVTRTAGAAMAPGTSWRAGFEFRGARREADVSVTEVRPPREIRLAGDGGGLKGDGTVAVEPDGAEACRLRVAVELSGSGLAGRALLQSLRLVRGRLEERFERRVGEIAARLDERHRNRAGRQRA